MNTYKIYTTEGNREIISSLTELRTRFNMTKEETSRCFYRGVHTVSAGKVITF